jgi:hypothetical protein
MRVLAIAVQKAQDATLPTLRYVPQEAEQIKETITSVGASTSHMMGPVTKEDVMKSLGSDEESAHIIHFACHGIQDPLAPHQSHFCLSDGPLAVSDLMKTNSKHALLAFLSACETAKGDQKHVDEVVHLAAAMMFVGFRSVIATMWCVVRLLARAEQELMRYRAMSDQDGPYVSKRFYEKLFGHEVIDVDSIAYTLDEAVAALRDSGAPPERWATFIHMGA